MPLRILSSADLDRLSRDARGASRRRLNLNLHDDCADPCQRLFNAVEPGSYIQPHRHTNPLKAECFVAVRGRFLLLLFDDAGGLTEKVDLAPDGPFVAVDIPAGAWHTILALEPGSICFEVKPGPYLAAADKDFPAWAPPEGSSDALWYLETLYEAVMSEAD